MTTHQAGTFCFTELVTAADPAAVARFYGPLLGWSLVDAPDSGATDPADTTPPRGGYGIFRASGRDVAGLRIEPDGARWIPDVHVADVDAAAQRARELGATIITPPTEDDGRARRAVVGDPEGAVFGLWTPRGCHGTQLETGPGSLWWVELATGDMAAARAFYAALFGWELDHTMKFENGPHGYTLFKVGDRSAAGAFQFEPEWGMTPAWQVYYQVDDFDATAARACELGGEQGFWRDAPNAGRIGVLVDPAGASFLIAQPLATA